MEEQLSALRRPPGEVGFLGLNDLSGRQQNIAVIPPRLGWRDRVFALIGAVLGPGTASEDEEEPDR